MAGCGTPARVTEAPAGGQIAFRVRSDFAAGLSADRGWAGALNENVTVHTDRPFRIRFEVEGVAGDGVVGPFRLQYRRGGGDWTDAIAEDFPKPAEASPLVSVVSSPAYENGAATTDLLTASRAPFSPGAGVALAATTPAWTGGRAHGEWEWSLVIRRFADGPVTSEEGDRFELRMVRSDGAPLGSYNNPVLALAVPRGHVGGTFVETPSRVGPWEATNGDLYFIMEPTETDNLFMMVKSSDGGATWREVDGANRPPATDLEGVGSEQVGHTIHAIHQTTRRVWYHSFRTSDHPTHPDSWDVRSELVATPPGEPPTQVASVAGRPDGSIVAVYGGAEKILLRIRTPAGKWSDETVIDEGLAPNLSGPQVVRGAAGVVHLAYTGADGTAWYRRILPDGKLTARERLATGLGTANADRISILPLVFIPETNTLVLIYRLATGRLWERRIVDHGAPSAAAMATDREVVQSAVDSHQTGADAVADGTTVHLLFIEKGSGSIFHTRTGPGGAWQPSTLQVEGIRGSWIRGTVQTRRGRPVYGYIYDAGSEGGSGMNRFAELPLGR